MDIVSWVLIFLIVYAALLVYSKSSYFQLKCIISDVDQKKYCVRDRTHLRAAADLLATCTTNMGRLVTHCGKKHPNNETVNRLAKNYNPQRIQETLPTSELSAYSQNKGESISFCLNKYKNGGGGLIDINTLMFVAIHELAHVATESVGHTPEFWKNFKFLLGEAKSLGIYEPVDYSKKPSHYCGVDITDNPFYDQL